MARRVLLADDSVTAQNMGRRILIDAGYEVITVNNGSAALKKIAEHKPDLIIVDVYMPGYGGLEVCSRIKETKETSRIPVLLTVGKLEPFKPEEARRVRADAFIVKPFDASELLTALTKLEDKIVPSPEPYKPGRFAKALASVQGSADKNSEDFGDVESGWKNRLTIPPPHLKSDHPQPEAEAPKPPAQAARDLGRDEEFKPADLNKNFERPLPAGVPQDIRPEEIAAIAAAAAALRAGDEKPQANVADPVIEAKPSEEPKLEETKPVEVPEVVADSKPAAEEPAQIQPVAEIKEEVSEKAQEKEAEKKEETREEEPVIAQAEAEAVAETKASPAEAPESEKVSDAEVLAALASLTPANGDFTSEKNEPEPVTVAAGAALELTAVGATYSGPRWIAEPVSVPIDEASRPLEQEMYKSFAALAAMEGAKLLMAAPSVETEAPRSETVPMSPEAPSETAPAEAVGEPAAMAAAAGANVPSATDSIAQPMNSASTSVPDSSESEPRREAELAAAWENWRHIRETIIDPETAPAVDHASAEAPAEVTKNEEAAAPAEVKADEVATGEVSPVPVAEAAAVETHPDEKSEEIHASEEVKAESDSEGDPEAIASIVDDMLADLKPKLMEELSKKLAKGKKKKKS